MRLRLRLAPRDRRAVTLAAIILVPTVGWTAAIRPYRLARAELVARVEEQRQLLARERALLRESRGLPRELRDATDALEAARIRLLPGRDALAATGALVSIVGDAARRRGVLIESIESRGADRPSGGLVSVRIEVRGRGDFEGLLRWLQTLESDPLLLRVDGLSVSRSGDRGDAEPDSLDTETLALSATVRAYVGESR
jgi:type II secretory pathway component PulM